MDKARLATIALVGAYFLNVAWNPQSWRMLDGVDLLIHEAGHPVFGLLGEFMGFAGGTLMQVLVPAAFVFHFLRDGKPFQAILVSFWVGQSLLNISVYASDAQDMALPLFGAGERIHDWNWMLSELGLLGATPWIAGFIRLLGTGVILGAIALGLALSGVPLPLSFAARTGTPPSAPEFGPDTPSKPVTPRERPARKRTGPSRKSSFRRKTD